MRCGETGLQCRIPAPHEGQDHAHERGRIRVVASPGQTVFAEVEALTYAATVQRESDHRSKYTERNISRAEKRVTGNRGRPPKPLVHGTYAGYKKGCRCGPCGAANSARQREYRASLAAVAGDVVAPAVATHGEAPANA